MIKILLSGCSGMMGQTISKIVEESEQFTVTVGLNSSGEQNSSYPVYFNINDVNEDFDVIVDFSHHELTIKLLEFATIKNKPVVLATTGHTKEQLEKIYEFSNKIPIFFASNTSIGVNLVIDLLKRSVPILQKNNFDIEIIEKHHNKKIDAPSGTALTLANSINEASSYNYDYIFDRNLHKESRSRNEIGIHSVRGGTIVGEHSVIFAGDDEIIEIKHSALSKKVFARGALNAAKFMIDKPIGLYEMNDLLK